LVDLQSIVIFHTDQGSRSIWKCLQAIFERFSLGWDRLLPFRQCLGVFV
jgi:hypothetical protein